jgi:hypothetical protein
MVETLVVATIFTVIALGIATTFITGMKLWSRAKNIDFSRYEFLLELGRISRTLRQSLDVSLIGFEGNVQEVSFPTLMNDSIVKITYKFDPQEKILLQKTVSLNDIIAGKEKENSLEKKIISLEDLTFSYCYFDSDKESYVWQDDWTKDKGIFLAIKLQAKFKGSEFVKTEYIPIS